MARTHYDRQRDVTDALLDRTARLLRLRDQVDAEIAVQHQRTRAALLREAETRRNGNPQRMERMLAASNADTSDAAD
jgi:hypothetical protein